MFFQQCIHIKKDSEIELFIDDFSPDETIYTIAFKSDHGSANIYFESKEALDRFISIISEGGVTR